jgi:hypothetical protein
MGENEESLRDIFIDYSQKNDQELKEILNQLLKQERKISYERRILHGKIDILRAELVRRKKERLGEGQPIISDEDIERLSEILAGRVTTEEQ